MGSVTIFPQRQSMGSGMPSALSLSSARYSCSIFASRSGSLRASTITQVDPSFAYSAMQPNCGHRWSSSIWRVSADALGADGASIEPAAYRHWNFAMQAKGAMNGRPFSRSSRYKR